MYASEYVFTSHVLITSEYLLSELKYNLWNVISLEGETLCTYLHYTLRLFWREKHIYAHGIVDNMIIIVLAG